MVFRNSPAGPAGPRFIAAGVIVSLVLGACNPFSAANSASSSAQPTRVVATVDASVVEVVEPTEVVEASPDPSAEATDAPAQGPVQEASPTAERGTASIASNMPTAPVAPACAEVKPKLPRTTVNTAVNTAAAAPQQAVSEQAVSETVTNTVTSTLTSSLTNTVSSTASVPAGQIVYLTDDGNIALIDAAGAHPSAVTSDAFVDETSQTLRVYQFPTFSNDGASLAFVRIDANGTNNAFTQTLHIAQAADKPALTDLYETTAGNIPYLDWSPDNSKLAFLTIAQAQGAIRLVSATGGPIATLDTGSSAYWHWRNDSTAIVAHLSGASSTSSDAHLSVINDFDLTADKSALTRLTSLPGDFQAPQFSPDGQFMLYVAGHTEGATSVNDLVLADAAGKPVCTVTQMEAGAFFAWSPNGTQIAYLDTVAPLQAPRPLTILDLQTGKRLQIERDGIMFFWAPTGDRLALYSIADVPVAAETNSTENNSADNAQTAQTRKVLRIEMIDAASGKVVPVADTLPTRDMAQFFQFFDQYSRAMTPWSPDGHSLVFVSADPNLQNADIGVGTLNAANSAVTLTRIAAGSMAFWSPK